jgi:hypothetical protein
MLSNLLNSLFSVDESIQSRSINAENPTGKKNSGGQSSSKLGPSRKGKPCLDLPQGKDTVLADISGPGIINHIWITVQDVTDSGEYVLRDLILRMYWDGEETPSVEVPLGDFFCCGFARNCRVNSLPVTVAPYGGYNCFFQMPFRKHARITIENQHGQDIHAFFYTINYSLHQDLPKQLATFHAQWRRERYVEKGKDYTILDNIKGKGSYIGTYLAWTALERYWWGEGEIKFYIDGDKDYPTICGTGVEDYVGGAWGFYEKDDYGQISREESTYNSPFMGYPYHSTVSGTRQIYGYDAVPMHGLYRWHILDPIHFSSDLRVTIQDIGHDGDKLFERTDDIASVAYWYQAEPHDDFPALPSAENRWPR